MSGTIDRYAVIGNPVAHSRSPFIHAAFAEQTGQALQYERILAPLDGFVPTLEAFVRAGGRGCNVTVPFKFEVPALSERCTPRVRLAQAANTLRFDAEGWLLDNTDGLGLVADLQHHAGVSLAGKHLLLLGAGGASAGVLGPLVEAGAQRIVVLNRTAAKAMALVDRHRDWARQHQVDLAAGGLDEASTLCAGGVDVLINGTASSLSGGTPPVSHAVLRAGTVAVDMMYGPAAEPFLHWAASHGAVARDGLGMLVEQAAAAFTLWRGVAPATAPVLAALRATLTAPAD